MQRYERIDRIHRAMWMIWNNEIMKDMGEFVQIVRRIKLILYVNYLGL